MKRWMLTLALAVAAMAWLTDSAGAQTPRYQPRRPTFSPYFDYFRRDTGLLDPYNYFVPRRIRLNQTLEQQQADINQTERNLRRVGEEVEGRFRAIGASPTGHGATFMNYSHYYQMGGGGRR